VQFLTSCRHMSLPMFFQYQPAAACASLNHVEPKNCKFDTSINFMKALQEIEN